jgi:hypothetical protein
VAWIVTLEPGEAVTLALGRGLWVGLDWAVGVALWVGLRLPVGDAWAVSEGEGSGLPVLVRVAVGLWLVVTVVLGVSVTESARVCVRLTVAL